MVLGYKTSKAAGGRFELGGAKAVSLLALIAAGTAIPVSATVVDRPYFKANSVVIVFGADDFAENGGTAPIVYDFYLLDNLGSGVAGNDIIGVDGRTINYNSGRYNAIQSGDESGWEFQVNDAAFGGDFISSAPNQTLDANDAYTAFGLRLYEYSLSFALPSFRRGRCQPMGTTCPRSWHWRLWGGARTKRDALHA